MAVGTIEKNADNIKNKDRKFGSANEYFLAKVKGKDGISRWAMFTENELSRAVARAEKNPEDIPQTIWQKLAFWK